MASTPQDPPGPLAVKSSQKQRDTLRSLGLGRIGKSTERPETPQLRGQIQAVGHLLEVEDA